MGTHAHGDRFLANVGVAGPREEPLCVSTRQLLLGAADDEHLPIQLDRLLGRRSRGGSGGQRNNHKVGRSTRCLMRWRNRAAGAPSTRRWSKVKLSESMRRTATCSLDSSTTTGLATMRPMPRMAHCGKLTMGVNASMSNIPRLVIVNVAPLRS